MIRFRCECGKSMKADPKHTGLGVTCPRCGKPNTVPDPNHPGFADTDRIEPVRPDAAPPSDTAAVTETVKPDTAALEAAAEPPQPVSGDTTRVQAVVPDTDRFSPVAAPIPAPPPAPPVAPAPPPAVEPQAPPRQASGAGRKIAVIAACVLIGLLLGAGGVYQLWYVPRAAEQARIEAEREHKRREVEQARLADIEKQITAALTAKNVAGDARKLAEAARAPIGSKALWASAERLTAQAEASHKAKNYKQAAALWVQARDTYLAAKVAVPLTPAQMAKRLVRAAATLTGHKVNVNAVAFSPNGKLLASGGDDNIVRVWDVMTHDTIATLKGHIADVNAVAFSPDGTLLASAGDSKIIRLWRTQKQDETVTLEGHGGPVRALAFSPNGATLASTGDDGTVRLWDTVAGKEIVAMKGDRLVRGLAFSPDGKQIATCGVGFLSVWDVAARKANTVRNRRLWATGVAWSPDGKTIATGGVGSATLWDASSRRFIASLRVSSGGRFDWRQRNRSGASVAFNIDGKLIAVGSGTSVSLYDVARRRRLATISTGRSSVRSVSISSDGRSMATAHSDGSAKLWGKDG
jgi:WD40 repeat protein